MISIVHNRHPFSDVDGAEATKIEVSLEEAEAVAKYMLELVEHMRKGQ